MDEYSKIALCIPEYLSLSNTNVRIPSLFILEFLLNCPSCVYKNLFEEMMDLEDPKWEEYILPLCRRDLLCIKDDEYEVNIPEGESVGNWVKKHCETSWKLQGEKWLLDKVLNGKFHRLWEPLWTPGEDIWIPKEFDETSQLDDEESVKDCIRKLLDMDSYTTENIGTVPRTKKVEKVEKVEKEEEAKKIRKIEEAKTYVPNEINIISGNFDSNDLWDIFYHRISAFVKNAVKEYLETSNWEPVEPLFQEKNPYVQDSIMVEIADNDKPESIEAIQNLIKKCFESGYPIVSKGDRREQGCAETAMQYAIYDGTVDLVKFLFDKGYKRYAKDSEDETPEQSVNRLLNEVKINVFRKSSQVQLNSSNLERLEKISQYLQLKFAKT